jgi:hypothetical protein
MKDVTAQLLCFLFGHDLRLYRLVCRNHFRLVCHRCHSPDTDTLKDKWQHLRNQLDKPVRF